VIHHSHPDGRHYPVTDCPIYICARTGQAAHVDTELFYRADGAGFPVEYWVRPIMLDEELKGAICTFVDITERRTAQTALNDLNSELAARVADLEAERDRIAMMSREIDHRVMNSLQFVSALLEMQSRAASHPDIAAQLEIAATRVAMVARVHRHFYLDEAVETICALEYARRLMADIATLLGPVSLNISGETTAISTTLILPLGLILNEIVTNAAKHGAQSIVVAIAPAGSGVQITVTDNGPGLPADFDPAARKGLGMRVVGALLRQHRGKLEFGASPAGGASFSIRLA
jgi:two-component sensor histidine kinase